jgi:hypothetical protein
MVNDAQVDYDTIFENETLSIIYFEYHHSIVEITIVPEILNVAILPLLMLSLMLVIIWAGKRAKPKIYG